MRDFASANELRYLSIADEALRNNTFFAFTTHGVPYADKPPLYIWIIMALRWILGSHQMWAISLASVIPSLTIVHIMDKWTKDEMDTGSRSMARIMLLTTGLFTALSLTLRMDMLMCMFIVLAMHSFWKIYTSRNKKERWLFPIYLFLALFTKGPLGILIPLAAITTFLIIKKDRHTLRVVAGWRTWAILLSGCTVWFYMVYNEGGIEYLNDLVFHQTVDRAVNSFHHNRPFYFYLACIWYCLAPWSLLIIYTITAAMKKGVVRSDIHYFFIVASITTFILLSLISSKLQVYILPAIPFMVYSAAIYMQRIIESKWLKSTIIIPAAILGLSLPALIIYTYCYSKHSLYDLMLYMSALTLSFTGIYVAYTLICDKEDAYIIEKAVKRLGIGFIIAIYMAGFALPQLNIFIGYEELCSTAIDFAKEKSINKFTAWDMSHARDMDVYLKQNVNIIPDEANPWDSIRQSTLLFIPARDIRLFKAYETRRIGNYAIVAIKKEKDK